MTWVGQALLLGQHWPFGTGAIEPSMQRSTMQRTCSKKGFDIPKSSTFYPISRNCKKHLGAVCVVALGFAWAARIPRDWSQISGGASLMISWWGGVRRKDKHISESDHELEFRINYIPLEDKICPDSAAMGRGPWRDSICPQAQGQALRWGRTGDILIISWLHLGINFKTIVEQNCGQLISLQAPNCSALL